MTGVQTCALPISHGFVWRDGRMRDLGTLGGDVTEPRGFNVLGHVVGVSSIAPGGELHAFLWRDGRMTDLGPTTELQPAGINVWGQVVGCSLSPETGRNELVLWQNGRTADLTALAGGGHPANCAGRGMNDRGQIVAAVQDPDTYAGPFRGVLWTIPVLWGHLPH